MIETVTLQDNDGQVDFQEFVKLFTGVSSIKEFITGEA